MSRARPKRDERGSALPLVVALGGLVMLIGLASAFTVATAVAHRRAQAAADLAALAGATALQRGRDPCAAAADVGSRNGADRVECRLAGADVLVTARLRGPRFSGLGWELVGRARAGPG